MGNSQKCTKIITSISLAFDNHIVIEALEMKFTRMIEYLSKEEGIYVGKVTARQVVLNDGLLADCTLDLSREEMPFETIDKYKKNIQKYPSGGNAQSQLSEWLFICQELLLFIKRAE